VLIKKTSNEKRANRKNAEGLIKRPPMKKEATPKTQKGSPKRPPINKEAILNSEVHPKNAFKRGTIARSRHSSVTAYKQKFPSKGTRIEVSFANHTIKGEGDTFWFESQTRIHTNGANGTKNQITVCLLKLPSVFIKTGRRFSSQPTYTKSHEGDIYPSTKSHECDIPQQQHKIHTIAKGLSNLQRKS
jgi:hypothetical protein